MKAQRLANITRRAGSLCTAPSTQFSAVRCAPKCAAYKSQRSFSTTRTRASGLRDLLWVSEEVSDAVATHKPVVALESTIYTHGAMGKDLAREHDELVRSHGGIPAIIAIVDGVPKVGVSPQEIVRMIETEGTVKVSRRDISFLVGMGLAGRKIHGGTTIAGTMILARLAGIRVFGTGGLGGVHRDGENSMDISADLTELGRTRVAVIAAGCKGFLDLPRTLEFLETQGALVSTFADGREGKVDFPAFWARDSGVKSPAVVNTEAEAAAIILAQEKLGIESGMLFANPIPEQYAIPRNEIQTAIEQATREATEKGFTGSSNTPYVLGRIKELTGDKAYTANKALVKENIIRATKVSVELSRLLSSDSTPTGASIPVHIPILQKQSTRQQQSIPHQNVDVLVAGSVAIDLNCDYAVSKAGDVSPKAHTSNPARISQSIGGVGHNVALAAQRANPQSPVRFCSLVGDDVAGSTVLSSLKASGLDTSFVRSLKQEEHPESRTAQYVAVNDGQRDLVMAMADMNIFTQHPLPEFWESAVESAKPKWLVVDGNWNPEQIRTWLQLGRDHGSNVAFEPVSVEKSRGLFCPERGLHKMRLFPNPSVHLASPNSYELAAMHEAAQKHDYFESSKWFGIIDAFGMIGARDRFIHLTNEKLTDAGIPLQSVQLLPYIPTLITKLGSQGVLLTTILARDDPRLRDVDEEEYILTRAPPTHPTVGGIYMRLFPPVENVKEVVSVNGVGDTFLGVLIAGLAQGGRTEKLIDIAQKGAVLSLKWQGSVSPQLSSLENELKRAAMRK